MKRITCSKCGKPVSDEVNDGVRVFGIVTCTECDVPKFEKKIETLDVDSVKVNVKKRRY